MKRASKYLLCLVLAVALLLCDGAVFQGNAASGSITVTNHSNVDVQVTVAYLPEPDTGVKGVLKNASARLKAGIVGDYKGADRMTATLTVSGKPEKTVTAAGTNVGKLRITIQ